MKIEAKIFGILRKKVKGFDFDSPELQIPDGAHITDAIAALNLEGRTGMVMLNGSVTRENPQLRDGDRLAIWPAEAALHGNPNIKLFSPAS